MSGTSKQITIFEGPDGSGKSTAAQAYATATGARYVHLPAFPGVTKGLARMYLEAMLPALLGYQAVVLDRCWLSEAPYGVAFRQGADHLTQADRRMLERVALRCGAAVVLCRPNWETVRSNYAARRHLEMLTNEDQLRQVYEAYGHLVTALPMVAFDYQTDTLATILPALLGNRHHLHPLANATAGSLSARIALVGEAFGPHKDCDAFQQYPFVSFGSQGCSQWLTNQLDLAGVPETDLLWLNADQDLELLYDLRPDMVIALGDTAYRQLYTLKIPARLVAHPQHWKRFKGHLRYPLIDILRG